MPDASMLANHVLLWALTGSEAMAVFQTLSAGNIGQPGAPGTVVAAPASLATAMSASDDTRVSWTVAKSRRAASRFDRCVTHALSTAPEPHLSERAVPVHNARQNIADRLVGLAGFEPATS